MDICALTVRFKLAHEREPEIHRETDPTTNEVTTRAFDTKIRQEMFMEQAIV
jgi:hypothetical protein